MKISDAESVEMQAVRERGTRRPARAEPGWIRRLTSLRYLNGVPVGRRLNACPGDKTIRRLAGAAKTAIIGRTIRRFRRLHRF
jgi:hypothetical protein